MTALICGSFAYDTIMVFPDQFKRHILPDKLHILNVSFLVPDLRREFGGCAGNIAYNLQLLGGKGLPMGTVGHDFEPYMAWLKQQGIDTRYITVIPDQYTAQAYITTDQDDNQITAFHPGAMNFAERNGIPTQEPVQLAIISPDGRQGMIDHARQLAAAGIPFIFDPGQGMPMFDGHDLLTFIEQATWVTVNDYEAEVLQERTGLSAEAIAARVEAFIVTRGNAGSYIYTDGRRLAIPGVPVERVVDPTGCGDAYRAGLLYGILHKLDWETTGRIASLLGALKIAHPGTQNHRFMPAEFAQQFQQVFGYSFLG